VKIYEQTERSTFVPQKPYRAPWAVIFLFIASLSFLAGVMLVKAFGPHDEASLATLPFQSNNDAPDYTNTVPKKSQKPLFGLSDNPVADIVAAVSPAVVSIDTTIHKTSGSSVDFGDLLFSHPQVQKQEKYEAHGSGSGVVIRSDGYILTNAHVVKDADDIKITLNNKHVYTGHVLGKDSYTDVALVKIDAVNLPVARMADSRKVRPGDWAIAIGSPLGLSQTVTMGIVSAVGRSLADLNNNVDLIQTDAAINPGNSGGPLLNIHGEVVGINMAIRTDAQNIGFSIPIDTAREAANAIISHRPIARPYLGISMIDVTAELAKTLGLPDSFAGVIVSKVSPSSPAQGAGLQEGDVIEKVNAQPVKTGRDVQTIVRAQKVGNSVDMEVVHSGKTRHVMIHISQYPSNGDDLG
jgi:S1-C subfamily serine protease